VSRGKTAYFFETAPAYSGGGERKAGARRNCETPLLQPSDGSILQKLLYVYCGDYVFLRKKPLHGKKSRKH
jgi:hypothetical protein